MFIKMRNESVKEDEEKRCSLLKRADQVVLKWYGHVERMKREKGMIYRI